MLKDGKIRVMISLKKESNDLIQAFANVVGMTKSSFIEDVCLTFINDVVEKQKERDKK